MAKVITISREFGSGGREIGQKVAALLGLPFYDKEIISMAAEESNIALEVFQANDEAPPVKERERNRELNSYFPVYEIPVSDQTFFAQSNVVKKLAFQGPCVIVGRCSDVILDDSLDIFICASLKKRAERMLTIDPEAEENEVKAKIRKIDEKRRDYYQYYTGNVWGGPQNYSLCLNSGRLGIQGCVDMIAAAAGMGE